MMRRLIVIALLVHGLLAGFALPVDAQTTLATARELYASASYDEALTALNGLLTSSQPDDRPVVATYRVLCLVALGRSGEVDGAIEALVSQHPLYRPAAEELSPRMRTAFAETRARLLPALIQKRYAEGKAAYDGNDFAAAAAAFNWVLAALADPDVNQAASRSPLADIRTLAAGFHDLSEKALAPPPVTVAPVVAAAPPPAPTRDYRRLYTINDTDAIAPVTVKQNMPRFPGPMLTSATGVLEIVVDVTGAVESVRMLEPVHPQYDPLVLAAAKKWQFQPARIDGIPVKYAKRVQIALAPTPDDRSASASRAR